MALPAFRLAADEQPVETQPSRAPARVPGFRIAGATVPGPQGEAPHPAVVWPTPQRRITQESNDAHIAWDIGANRGDPIQAVIGGTVEQLSPMDSRGYGNLVVVKHDDGTRAFYAHLDRFGVQPGQRVRPGDVLGAAGDTGQAWGTHLHLEFRTASGAKIPPETFFGMQDAGDPISLPSMQSDIERSFEEQARRPAARRTQFRLAGEDVRGFANIDPTLAGDGADDGFIQFGSVGVPPGTSVDRDQVRDQAAQGEPTFAGSVGVPAGLSAEQRERVAQDLEDGETFDLIDTPYGPIGLLKRNLLVMGTFWLGVVLFLIGAIKLAQPAIAKVTDKFEDIAPLVAGAVGGPVAGVATEAAT